MYPTARNLRGRPWVGTPVFAAGGNRAHASYLSSDGTVYSHVYALPKNPSHGPESRAGAAVCSSEYGFFSPVLSAIHSTILLMTKTSVGLHVTPTRQFGQEYGERGSALAS